MTVRSGRLQLSFGYLPIAVVCLCAVVFEKTFPASVVCIVLHEAGHIIMLFCSGAEAIEIKLGLMCADIIDTEKAVRGDLQEIVISLAGPAANLFCVPIFAAVGNAADYEFFRQCALFSGILCVFNLIPAGDTDGSTVLRIMIGRKYGLECADRVVFVITAAVMFPLLMISVLILLRTRRNFTPLMAVAALFYSCMKNRLRKTK